MLFTPVKIGPLELRNRAIRAAAFEGMSPNNAVSEQLIDYHRSVAAGGVGMTTVAYAAVSKCGLSFKHQLWLNEQAVQPLRKLTDAVHRENAAVSLQIGHCGNMAKYGVTGTRPVAPSARINLFAPSFPRKMDRQDIKEITASFGNAVTLAQEAGFDAVEVHAGHGYLISQFLSPYTNRRKDEFGGSLSNRMKFMEMIINEVLEKAGNKTAVIVKMNMRDGFEGGMEQEESLQVATKLQELGAHALVLSGGFVSKAPMYVMRGAMPVDTLADRMDGFFMRAFVRFFGKALVPDVPFKENYFLEDARLFRQEIKLPLIYVGGILSHENIENVLSEGFDAVAIARALIQDPAFISKIRMQQDLHSGCNTCNHCIAVMYNGPFECIRR